MKLFCAKIGLSLWVKKSETWAVTCSWSILRKKWQTEAYRSSRHYVRSCGMKNAVCSELLPFVRLHLFPVFVWYKPLSLKLQEKHHYILTSFFIIFRSYPFCRRTYYGFSRSIHFQNCSLTLTGFFLRYKNYFFISLLDLVTYVFGISTSIDFKTPRFYKKSFSWVTLLNNRIFIENLISVQ
jgi:hypothetical protein